MNRDDRTRNLLEKLREFGDAHNQRNWPARQPDYVATLGLTAEDVPHLIAVARDWAERKDWPEDVEDLSVYAAVHAWRALAQLGAEAAIAPLIEMLPALDDLEDDWFLEEFPQVFALIGPASVEPLAAALADAGARVYVGACVAHGLCELALRHPATREPAIEALRESLRHCLENPEDLNGFVISYLLKIGATEAAEVIERAYAADRVDTQIVGNWATVRHELGVPGLGLVPEEVATRRPPPLFPFLEKWRDSLPGGAATVAVESIPAGTSRPAADLANRKRLRAKRKRERQNRKRGRRR